MDPISNPYAPGAGTPPPELAGRNDLRENARIALERTRIGRPSKSLIMVGLRGVGKTVLLDQIRKDAEASRICALQIEVSEDRSLPAILAPQLRFALLNLSRVEAAKKWGQRGLRALKGFVSGLKLTFPDIEVGLGFDSEPGLADSGDLETDLQDLLQAVGEAAKAGQSCVALFLDEIQYAKEDQLAALIMALHRTSQRQLPVIMVGAGLPQVRGRTGRAKSYAERLFDFPEIGALSSDDARLAIAKPASDVGVEIESGALDEIVSLTRCYPYFLQEWGKHSWDVAQGSPITLFRCGSRLPSGDSRPRSEFLPGQVRQTDSRGKEICASDGRTWPGPSPFR